MPTVLITGANRGLGLEFARQYCRDGWRVIATARDPTDELEDLCVRVEEVDMLDLDEVAEFGADIEQFLLAQSVLPAVERSGGKLIGISTKMGSIEDNTSGGFIAYRSSKAALNMAWRSLAIDAGRSGVIAAVLHPGWVQT